MSQVQVTLTFDSVHEAEQFFAQRGAPLETPKPEPTGDATAPVERSAVSALAVKLAVKDKAKAVEILAEHGVKAVKELADDDLAAVHAKLTAALGG